MNLDALVRDKAVQATLNSDISNIDLHALHLAENPVAIALCSRLYFASDLRQEYKLQGLVNDLTVATKDRTYRPKSIAFYLY